MTTLRRRTALPVATPFLLTTILFFVMAILSLAGCAGGGRLAFDPAVQDPAFDAADPPLIWDGAFEVEGARLNAIIYEAQGPGPHPTLLLLHGFPGNERNLDLGQAARRAGWNVVFFHYRGSWGSGGVFTFVHVVEDVLSVVEQISEPAFAKAHRIDPDRLALVGHSMGGFASLIAGAESASVDCVASLAGANLGGFAMAAAISPEQRDGMVTLLDSWSGPIRGASGQVLVSEVLENADRFNTMMRATDLAPKTLLLIAGKRDDVTEVTLHHDPLVEVLKAAGAERLQSHVYEEGDHSFSGQRIQLATRLVAWLESDCRSGR